MVTTPTNGRLTFVNVLGTLGYISVIFQWLWAIIVVAHPILSSDMSFIIPQADSPAPITPTSPPSTFAVIIVVALTILIFAFTLYVIWKLPAAVGKRGSMVTKRTADTLVPIISAHRPQTKKQRRMLSRRLILLIKFALILIPVAALGFATPVGELTLSIIWIAGLFCAACSSVYFAVQQLLGKLWRLTPEQIW